MWVNHKWLWVWAVVVKVEGGRRGGVAAYSQDVLLEFFCRLRSEVKSTNQHLFCSACIISQGGLTYCAVKVLGCCGENKGAEAVLSPVESSCADTV